MSEKQKLHCQVNVINISLVNSRSLIILALLSGKYGTGAMHCGIQSKMEASGNMSKPEK